MSPRRPPRTLPQKLRQDAERRTATPGHWILLPWIVVAPLVACGGQAGPEPTGTSASPIYAGVEDNDAQQSPGVVAVEVDNGGTTTFELCTGSLVAPNVVLTARHCVSAQTSTQITCDQNGVSAAPPDFSADEPLGIIHVFTGPSPSLLGTPAASAAAVFHPAGNTLCNLDLALIVLDKPITGIEPMRVRLSGPPTDSESMRTVGYGENDQNAPIGTRFRKDGVTVLAVGSTVSASMTPLASNEFEMGESMCNGDSGGPALDSTTGAIVGIVSRGGACTDTTGHIYTSLAGFTSVFTQAFAMAGGAPITEGEPYPDAGGTTPTGSGSGSPAGSGSGSGSASASGSGSGGNGTEPRGSGEPVNLHAGQGSGCSASASDAGSAGSAGLMLLVMTGVASLARRRAARQPVRYTSKHG
jgi:MYXO-CTERM domain-containing protein